MLIGLIGKKSLVKTAQVVIPDTNQDSGEFDKVWKCKIDALGSVGVYEPTRVQFAFQITCCGRGSAYHNGIENHESSLFRKSFPKLPLFGFFSNGELGHDHFSKHQQNKSDDFYERLQTYTFSSIFTIISINT